MTVLAPRGILVTGDVHSHLEHAPSLLDGIARASQGMLIADSGDFFEGTGYHRLGGGAVEREILTRLYDVLAPGNHGFGHYLSDPALYEMTVCTNIVDGAGKPVFRPSRPLMVGGVSIRITAVMSPEAFATIPAAEREGLRAVDPAAMLRALAAYRPGEASRAVVVLSHSGWDADVRLARACPFITVLFSGHCHSDRYGPARVGEVLLLKGREHAVGYAQAHPVEGSGWGGRIAHFQPPAGPLREDVADLQSRAAALRATLAHPRAPVREGWSGITPQRATLLRLVAKKVLASSRVRADVVVLNETLLRPCRLGTHVTTGTLMETAPFATRLAAVELDAQDAARLPERLAPLLGPVLSLGDPSRRARCRVVTSDYIARTHLRLPYQEVGALDPYVQRVLSAGQRTKK